MSPSPKCLRNFSTAIIAFGMITGIGLVGLGIYMYSEKKINTPKMVFINFYYIFFGILLVAVDVTKQKIYVFFNFLRYVLGRILFLIFLATITMDYQNPFSLIICILLMICAILRLIYFILTREPKIEDESPTTENKQNTENKEKPEKEGRKGFGAVNLEESEAKRKSEISNSGGLQRRK